MTMYLVRRLGLAVITLILLSMIVFFAGQVLPGDPARSILGPLASPSAVRALDHQLGVDRPLVTQYWSWISGLVHGDFGQSYQFRAPVWPFIQSALFNSIKLAALAFVTVVPLGIAGGVIFGIELKILPVTAAAGAGASPGEQLYHLILPAIPLILILFGYIARMARAGTIEALESDYARTATLKGLPRWTVIRRHVLRNSLLPTITVIATQTGYLIGGLVIVEVLFH